MCCLLFYTIHINKMLFIVATLAITAVNVDVNINNEMFNRLLSVTTLAIYQLYAFISYLSNFISLLCSFGI